MVRSGDFCPRPRLERRLSSLIRSGQNAALLGPRRVGKSSLINVFADERKGYEQIVSDITGQQLAVLRAIAQLGGESVQSGEFLEHAGITHASSSKASTTRLVQRRILHDTPQGFRFSNPFFRAWLLHMRY